MVTFKRVPTVASGDPVTSTEMAALADAVNDRIKSGLGDPTRRIHYYLSAMARQIRNPDSSGFLFPPVDEFRSGYEHVHPSDYVWPLTGPDEPEGISIDTILGTYVFGNETLDVKSEDLRLADPLEGGVDMDFGSGTAIELWELAKRQRGGVDASTGVVASPVFDAAKSHFAIIQNARSLHGNAYGGYQPTAEFLGDCIDPNEYGTYQLIFTPLTTGLPTYTFNCCCASESDNVATVLYYPGDRYEIYQNDGTLTTLAWNKYIEGPYAFGNVLKKTWGDHLSRVLNFFASEYSGTTEQKADENAENTPWLSHAFTTHEFLTTQYHLAPQNGIQSGDVVSPIYPQWELTGSTNYDAGEFFPRTNAAGTSHATPAGFVTMSALVHSQGLVGSCTVVIKDGLETIATAQLDATTPSRILTWTARQATDITVSLSTDLELLTSTSAHGIVVEVTELMSYKPTLWDLALLLRLCGVRMSPENGTDGSGIDEDQAKEIGDDYFANGCIVNRRLHIGMPGSADEFNTNAVVEAARRYSRQCSRQVPRGNLIGYEVTGGKSILYFKRLWNGISEADVFDGIAPSRTAIASGSLVGGRVYIATGGGITYKGTNYIEGAQFTAADDDLTYGGSGEAYEYNGIITTALKQGWTNEWVLDVMSLIPYQTLDTSAWKVDAFTDYVGQHFDRCTWEHPTPVPKHLSWHFSQGSSVWVSPESFPAFRYTDGINDLPCGSPDPTCEEDRRRKLRSCPIGELPHVIEKIEHYIEDGEERVKVTLATRLQHGSDAPASVDPDISTWVLATIQAEIESGRTAENGIREYLIHQFVGGNCVGPGTQMGNAAHSSTIDSGLDVPFGACYPRIGLTKLIPKPYIDDNNDQDPHDTPMESWPFTIIELYARAMVEGYVDTVSTEQYGCETGVYAVLDYTFESACFHAFSGRQFGCIQTVETDLAQANETRPDEPLFYGPLPNTHPSAEIFNQFASFWNLLTRVRLMLPLNFQARTGTQKETEFVKLYEADGDEVGCTLINVNPGVFNTFNPRMPASPGMGAWGDVAFTGCSYTIGIDDLSCTGGGGDWILDHYRTDADYRWDLLHTDYLEAIPVEWQDMIYTNGLLLGIKETTIEWESPELVTATNGEACNGDVDFWSGSGGEIIRFNSQTTFTSECVLLQNEGRLTAPLPPRSAIGVGREYDAGDLIYCVINAGSGIDLWPIESDALIISVDLV